MPKKTPPLRTLWIALALIGLLVLLNRVDGLTDNPVTQTMAQIVTYPARVIDSLESSVIGHWNDYVDLRSAKEEAQQLRGQLESRSLDLTRLDELEAENRRLRKLLDFSQGYRLEHVAAHIFSYDPSPVFQRFLIDRGSADHFVAGMPVLCHEGVAGRLGRVLGSNLSEVIFLNDPESRVDVFIGEARIRGVLSGAGHGMLKGLYVEWDQPIEAGDSVVTSGMAGVFPKGLLVGEVSKVQQRQGDLFLDIQVQPKVEYEHLEEVLILLPDAPDLP